MPLTEFNMSEIIMFARIEKDDYTVSFFFLIYIINNLILANVTNKIVACGWIRIGKSILRSKSKYKRVDATCQ